LPGGLQCVVNVDVEVAQAFPSFCDQRSNCTARRFLFADRSALAGCADRVCRIPHRMKKDLIDPSVNDAGVLPRANVRRCMHSAWEQIVVPRSGANLIHASPASRADDVISDWAGRCLAEERFSATLSDPYATRHERVALRDRSRATYYQCPNRTAPGRGRVLVSGAGREWPRCP
jgi:hypothetical protein